MRHIARLALAALFTVLAGCAVTNGGKFSHTITGDAKPWPHDNFDAAEGKFTFAVITDLTGGEREGIFQVAVEQLNLLRPEFVISVGDLIDGVSEDPASLAKEWDWFDERALKLRAPFFYVGGNHDLTGQALRDVWSERYGPLYYHFVYKDVLFLVLDTEDHSPEFMKEMMEARNAAIALFDAGENEKALASKYFQLPERITGAVSADQAAYFEKVIADNPGVRWTLLFMHKPIWRREDANPFTRIETALSDRPYTLFNGHLHAYSHTVRNGRDYMVLGTTGGGQDAANDASFDHVTLVTVGEDDLSIANLRMDGILDKTASIPLNGAELCFRASKCAPEN